MCAPSAPALPAMGVPYDYMQHVVMQAAQTPLPNAANTTPKYRVAGIAHRACVYLTRMLATLALVVIICILRVNRVNTYNCACYVWLSVLFV